MTTPRRHDLAMAEACNRMEPVVGTMHVTASECCELLRKAGWSEITIRLAFAAGPTPKRLQMRTTMLVVKPE
jgi:hypothetical protein